MRFVHGSRSKVPQFFQQALRFFERMQRCGVLVEKFVVLFNSGIARVGVADSVQRLTPFDNCLPFCLN